MNDKILGLVRMALVFVGGILVSQGHLTEGDSEALIGAVVALAGTAWSVYSKWGMAKVPVETLTTKQVQITGVEPTQK